MSNQSKLELDAACDSGELGNSREFETIDKADRLQRDMRRRDERARV